MAKPRTTAKYVDWIEGDGLLRIQDWFQKGLTNEEIAHAIGINRDTFREWLKKYPALAAAQKRGKDIPDI